MATPGSSGLGELPASLGYLVPQEFHLLILDGLANRHIRDFDDHLDDWQGRRGVLLQPCQSGRLCIRDPA